MGRVVAPIPRIAPPLCTTKLLRPASATKLHQSEYAGVQAQVASTPSVPVPMGGVTLQPRFVPVAGLGANAQGSKLNSVVHSPRQPVQAASWIRTMSPRAQTPVGS